MTIDIFSRRQFIRIGGLGLLGAIAFPITAQRNTRERTLYVGTYTAGKSEGIYVYRMDQMTGELRAVSSIKSINPSFLAIEASKRYLYAVNEVNDFEGNPTGAVSSFAIHPDMGQLEFINQQPSSGGDPCHLTIDRQRKSVLVANYTGGNISVLPIARDGSLGAPIDVEQHEGSGPKEQQKGAHAHCIILDRFNRHAFAADLGIDKVMIYRFDRLTGKLSPGKQPSATLHSGAGPRHLTFHPNGKYLYVINELDSSLTTFKYDASSGTLRPFETISTLPRDFSGTSYCADVHVSPSGRFLYGSNRGHNSIVVFEIDNRSGRLRQIEHVSTEGKWPRNFTIDPSGRFLLVANQHTDNVVTFKIDPQSGRLTPTGQIAEIPTPVCLKFL